MDFVSEYMKTYASLVGSLTDFQILTILAAGSTVITVLVVVLISKRWSKKTGHAAVNEPRKLPKPRFRKRDKVMFYGRKMLRKVRELKDEVLFDVSDDNLRRRRMGSRVGHHPLSHFAKRFLHRTSEEIQGRMLKEPPASFLEADFPEKKGIEPELPSEVMYMLRSVRVFGHFERPLFFELCKHIESKMVPAGVYLLKPGKMEDCIYIVQAGKLLLSLVDKGGRELPLKQVDAGDNIHSVLNILDAIKGNFENRFSLSARAIVDTQVLKLPSQAFYKVFQDHEESLVRVVQIIMLRLQQVTFQTLHGFLGLSSELISASSIRKKSQDFGSLSIYSLNKQLSVAEESTSGGLAQASFTKDWRRASKTMGVESIKEQPEVPSLPRKSQDRKEIRRSVSFTNSVTVMHMTTDSRSQGEERMETEPLKVRRSKSFNKLLTNRGGSVTAVGSCDQEDPFGTTSPSDFAAACSRAGVDIFESPQKRFSIGSPDDSPNSDDKYDFSSVPGSAFGGQMVEETKKFESIDPDQEEAIIDASVNDLIRILDVPDAEFLRNILAVACVSRGTDIIKQGDKDSSLYFLISGRMTARQKSEHGQDEIPLFQCFPGELMGALALLTGEPSLFTFKAENACYVVIISKLNFYSLMRKHPRVVLPVAYGLIERLSSLVRNIDFALDWMITEAGKPLYRQGDDADCIYIVLNGRLRAVRSHDDGDKKELVAEYGKGEFVGLVEVLTQSPRVSAVHAVRDTELAKIPDGLLTTVKLQYPQVVTRLIHLLGERLLGSFKKSPLTQGSGSHFDQFATNLGTIAVVPCSSKVPLANFTFELSLALNDIGPTLLLTSDLIKQRLGNFVLDSVHEYYLSNWLSQQEDIHRIVVYQTDHQFTEWTRRCIRQADAILIVGLGDEEPVVGQLEAQLENMNSVRAQKDLILLYKDDKFEDSRGTVEWLNARGWISAHHHVRCPPKIFKRRSIADRFAKDPNYEGPSKNSDFGRLARRLTGTSIGLVLGGGGAKGMAHVGVLKALVEAGIPIDMIGGTSMGSFIGALYAESADVVKVTQKAREFSWEMGSIRKLFDLTYPYTSLFSGRGFNDQIHGVFGERQIEDMLLPYFCVTTDITGSRMRVHQTGSLWRYVRASMSLSGYLPPLCDPVDGHLLLDGGYVNNVPADVMKSFGAATIIAVDVGSENENDLLNYGDSLNGWWLLWKRWNPFSENVKVPDLAEIQSRLAYVSCEQQLKELKASSYCHYVRPPIDRYKTLQFGSCEEIMQCGYEHGKAVFQSLLRGKMLPETSHDPNKGQRKDISLGWDANPSFTDLAELISRIDPQQRPELESNWLKTKSSANLFFHYQASMDDQDDETDLILARRSRTGSLSDQDLMPESDYDGMLVSSMEEPGYESEDLGKLKKMKAHVYMRTQSNMV